jgi:hypothetical protein
MGDKKEKSCDDVGEVPPMLLQQLRLRLARCESDSFEQHFELVKEIIGLGKNAVPLMALLVEKFRTGKLFIDGISLTKLCVNTQNMSLLHAMEEKNQLPAATNALGIFQLCELFEIGLPYMEGEFLDYLWKNQEAEPGSHEAVKSLGKYGGPAALEMLEAIRHKFSGELPEKKAKWMLCRSEEGTWKRTADYFEYSAHEQFLAEVTSAIARITQRIKDQPVPPATDTDRQYPVEVRGDVGAEACCKRIEVSLARFVRGILQRANPSEWWTEYVPLTIRQKCAQRQEEENNRVKNKEAYVDLIDLKAIMHKNWTLFEQHFREEKREGGKEKCLAWLDKVNELRRLVGHPLKKDLSGYSFSEPEKALLAEADDLAKRLLDKLDSGPSAPNRRI